MSAARMLVGLGIDRSGAFDLSASDHIVKTVGPRGEAPLGFMSLDGHGHLEIERSKVLDKVEAFTVEVIAKPAAVTKAMTLLASQSPPVTIRMDAGGVVVGAVHVAAGWVEVKSGAHHLAAKTRSAIRLLRNSHGKLSLEIDGAEVGTGSAPGALVAAGKAGFTVGAAVGGGAAFAGELGHFRVLADAVPAAVVAKRVKAAKTLGATLQARFGTRVRIEPDPAAVDHRLDQVKGILATVGVTDLSQLGTLKITVPTTVARGQVMVAPLKLKKLPLDWTKFAKGLATANASKAKAIRNALLPNRNSVKALSTHAPATPTTPTVVPIRPILDRRVFDRVIRNTPAARRGVLNTIVAGAAQPTAVATPAIGAAIAARTLVQPGSARRLPTTGVRGAALGDRISDVTSDLVELVNDLPVLHDLHLLDHLGGDDPELWPVMQPPAYHLTSLTTIPVGTSVIVAGVLDLTNTELRIEPTVKTLYIIAEEIICGTGARIAWRHPGGSTPARPDDADLNGRSWSGVHTAEGSKDGLDGGDGGDGITGVGGADGVDAPNIELWVKNMTAMPDVDLAGERGVRGGRGQRGGRGGNGARGEQGLWWWCFGIQCWSQNGHGGDGGEGGRGGRGGRGGDGAAGGNILIAVLEGTLASTVTAQAFKLDNTGGQAGKGGDGGPGGGGGAGGSRGWAVHDGEWYCDRGRDGHDGSQGQPGLVGTDGHAGAAGLIRFMEITEESWNEQLTKPWLTEVTPTQPFPGASLILKGSMFADTDRVKVGGFSLVPTINADDTVTVTLPVTIAGSEQELYVRRFDGRESNRLRIWVKPQLTTAPSELVPGASGEVRGHAFVSGATVLYDGAPLTATFVSATQLTFAVPGVGGANQSAHTVTLEVRNPDGRVSNTMTAAVPEVLDYGWKLGQHDYSFRNFSVGAPSWGTFEDTFGALEVWHELLDPVFGHPILTAAFYAFYNYFLKGSGAGGLATGFCTSLAATAADRFWTGHNDTATLPLDAARRASLTGVHGRLLSRETLLTMHDQGREGVSRVTTTFRHIESCFKLGMDRESAPLLFFIPSGEIWDSGYFDKLSDSHCVVPIRIVYPAGYDGSDLDGVKIYVWDNNHPHALDAAVAGNCRVELRRVGGQVRFSYFDGGSTPEFASEDGITLGTMSVGQYLLSDHDMPFTGPLGLTSFVIDFLLSPADMHVEDADGKRTGRVGNQILAEIPGSHPCYLAKGAYMLPREVALTRRITGLAAGSYAWHSIASDGTSVALEAVTTVAGQVDVVALNADGSQLRFTPGVAKPFTLTLSRRIDGQTRAIAVSGLSAGPSAPVDVTLSPELSLVRVGNTVGAANAAVRVLRLDEVGPNPPRQVVNPAPVAVPVDHDLLISVTDWAAGTVSCQALPFGP